MEFALENFDGVLEYRRKMNLEKYEGNFEVNRIADIVFRGIIVSLEEGLSVWKSIRPNAACWWASPLRN